MDDQGDDLAPPRDFMPASRLPLASMNRKMIAERVATLLSHYWTAEMDPKLRQLQSSDWLVDLGEFPSSIVSDACAEWRHKPGGRRPTPGDIRTICVEIRDRRDFIAKPALPRPMADPDFNERRYREAAECRDQWARSHGVLSFQHAMEIGLIAVSKMPVR